MEKENIAYDLLKTGLLAEFNVIESVTEQAPDKENVHVRVDLEFIGEEDDEPSDIVEWASFGFIFALAVFSFEDARPRGMSEVDFISKDEFGVSDLLHSLSFSHQGLVFRADYIRGRCMKTDIVIQPDGRITLTTWGRGQAALRWLDRIKGNKLLKVVQGDNQILR